MTFEEWTDSRKYAKLENLEHYYEVSSDTWGFEYPSCCVIEDTNTWKGRWYLVIGNEQWVSDDIEELEGKLWEWVRCNYTDN